MSKIKYTEEVKQKAIDLRLEGKSSTEITTETGIKKESLNKLFKERNIKLTEEQAAEARSRRWLNHEPVVGGKKICSKCGDNLPIDEFHKNNNRISGLVSSCKKCYGVYYEENAEEIKERVRIYGENHKDEKSKSSKTYYKEHKENYTNNAKKWVSNNPEKRKVIQKEYTQRNRPAKTARTAKYRATKIQATPKWLSQDQIDEMKRFYENCPKGYEVDHIVPLRGKDVRGLHVPWNLQYLSAADNNKKGNRM